ncbi:MAG: peptidylprolyl isomerase [Acidobacteriota bacterium]|nr:peptidylprolyl isomerase [Acidobacteriota bacterium]
MRHSISIPALLTLTVASFAQSPVAPDEPGLYATFNTSLGQGVMGQIVVKLFEDKAPNTVKNFVALATGTKATLDKKGSLVKRHYYDGLTFHRVIKGFMIQTGDVKATGSTPCGIPNQKDEIAPSLNFKEPGMLAMANTGTPNTGACQIFITVGRPDYLTGTFTIFGKVVSGQDVADKISQVPTVKNDRPLVPVTITSLTIQRKQ